MTITLCNISSSHPSYLNGFKPLEDFTSTVKVTDTVKVFHGVAENFPVFGQNAG